MVTLTSATNALKSVYLGVVSEQLNTNANPLFAKIKQTNKDVYGKEIIKAAPYGINGGIGAGTEDGQLPNAQGHQFLKFTATLKNLYGSIEISDKAVRASQNNAGAFVNLLNDEMESLIRSSSYNLGRMLYGDSTGKIATCVSVDESSNEPIFDSVRNFIEGMIVDVYGENGVKIDALAGIKVDFVDRATKMVVFNKTTATMIPAGATVYVAGSKDLEITGLGKIFSKADSDKVLYGVDRSVYPWLYPYINDNSGVDAEISDDMIQTAINSLEEQSGSEVDFIACSGSVRRAYQQYLSLFRRNVDVMNLQGGQKAISFNGIPVVYDRFVAEGEMYLLNTKDFALHQLCDWEWLEGEGGKVIKQVEGRPVYSATLVKYAELVCDKPNGQAKISHIANTVANPFTTI